MKATQPRTASSDDPAPESDASDLVAPSVLSSWTKTIVDALVAIDADVEAVLEAAGLSREAFRDPNGRLPMTATARLWRAAVEHMADPAFGLRVSKYVHQTTFYALGYSVFASETLRDALRRLVRYSHIVSDAAELHLDATHDVARLSFVFRPGVPPPSPESIDAVMSLIVRTGRMLTTREFTLRLVEQRRPQPADMSPYHRFFRSPIEFGRPVDALTIEADVLDRRLPTANAELASHNDDLVRQYLARLSEGNIVHRVRSLVIEHLSGDPSPAQIGSLLGMSARSLQRRLNEHGTTYGGVLADTRRELACEYLREPRYSVTEITFLLGFEDASAFARAFRRWMGRSPSEYRAQLERQVV